jgi:uncharacterized protein YbjQ (UPF0145 family)
MGRRPENLKDRRWAPVFVYGAAQCKSKPVSGSVLCETCQNRYTAYANAPVGSSLLTTDLVWHGRVDDTDLDSLPPSSHIAGSQWYNDRVATARLRFTGAEKPKTARQERGGGAAKRVLITDATLTHFADGRIELDIEELSGPRNEISGKQLAAVLSHLTGSVVKSSGTKAAMCARIRALMRGEPKAAAAAAAEPKAAAAAAAEPKAAAAAEPKAAAAAEPKAVKATKEGSLSVLLAGTALNVIHKGVTYGAVFVGPTEIRGDDGVTYPSINKFACACTGRSTNAWTTVRYMAADGSMRILDTLRLAAVPALSVTESDSEAEAEELASLRSQLAAALERAAAAEAKIERFKAVFAEKE